MLFEHLRKLNMKTDVVLYLYKTIMCYININSIRYKFDELKDILTDKLVDMFIIAETKIGESFNENLFKVEG